MIGTFLFWGLLNIFSILLLAFFSMSEMACVSLNKIRLQYYVGIGNARAYRLNELLKKPSHLFGATLIGVNMALVFSSEFARQTFAALGLDPDFAPLVQVLLVVIFGELAPMFAARHYSEHVAMMFIPFLSAWSRCMQPLLWAIDKLTKLVHILFGKRGKQEENFYLSKEELLSLITEGEEDESVHSSEFNAIVSNIFTLKTKSAEKAMNPLQSSHLISSTTSIGELRELLKKTGVEFFPVYTRELKNIIGVIFPRDVLRIDDHRRVKEHMRAPWFIDQTTPVLDILQQFRRNNQSVAIVLNDKGVGVGILSLQDILDEIFSTTQLEKKTLSEDFQEKLLIERTFPGDMSIREFNEMYKSSIDPQGCVTFSELILQNLGHHPEEGESIFISPFEIIVKETSFLEIKTILIKTRVI